MEFDKSKVYTALNADELKAGSKCIFADTVKRLCELVESDDMQEHVRILTAVCDDDKAERFEIDHTTYFLAYLIEPPKEPEYKPFSSGEKVKEAIDKHGGWIEEIASGCKYLVTAYNEDGIGLFDEFVSLQELNERFVFLDDGSPCGELAADLGIILQE